MINKRTYTVFVLIAVLFSLISFIDVENITISNIYNLSTWTVEDTTTICGNETLISFPMANQSYTGFIKVGGQGDYFTLGKTSLPLIINEEGCTGINDSASASKIEIGSGSLVTTVQQATGGITNYTTFNQYSNGFYFTLRNGTRAIVMESQIDPSTGVLGEGDLGGGLNMGGMHIYNNPEISEIWSPGVIAGGELTHSGQNINISSGSGMFRTTNDPNGQLVWYNFSGANFTFAIGDLKYVYVNYSSGTPQLLLTTNFLDINGRTSIELFQVFQHSATETLYIDARAQNVGVALKETRRLYDMERFRWGGGCMLSSPSGLNIVVSAGKFYYGNNPIDTPSFNTATGSTIEYYYRNTSTPYNNNYSSFFQTSVNNTHWDSGTNTPVVMNNNKYKTEFVFEEITSNGGDELSIVLGQVQHNTLADAEAESVPSILPNSINQMGVLIGRIIIQYNSPTIYSTSSSFTQKFSLSAATNHNNLAGLQGGILNEYYHINASQYNAYGYNASYALNTTMQTYDSLKVNKTGDTMTGSLYTTARLKPNGMDITATSGNGDFTLRPSNTSMGYWDFAVFNTTGDFTFYDAISNKNPFYVRKGTQNSALDITPAGLKSSFLTGSGNAALCVNSTGFIYRSTNATFNYLTC